MVKHEPSAILDATVGLMDEFGVGISTGKVARAAEVPNGTLFHYFPTKQALLDALYVYLKQDLVDAIGEVDTAAPFKAQARMIWDRWTSWAIRYPARHRVVQLLRGADLISSAAVDESASAFVVPSSVLRATGQAGLLVDLPLEHIVAVVEAQLELAVAAGLDADQRAEAFEMAWAGITALHN